ncbi:hypothetical protein GCM10014713_18100 [Streptomyces purpureus]|uniref:Uncharacterized protein n=2 Tax=Streptomyces purpureus TaxID=1951 RepID=A0A918LNA8_9ACTN|nr:hypothetical protein GCM10014713_18100 [Streptomyces purpureus]
MLPALIAVAYVLLQIVGKPTLPPANDAYRYARATLEILGDSREQAQHTALKAYCRDKVHWDLRYQGLDPQNLREDAPAGPDRAKRYKGCLINSAKGLEPTSPRYERIFDVRPGFAVLAVPAVAVLGAGPGLLVTSVLFTVLGGVLVYLLLRAVGTGRGTAAIGQAFYYASPIGWWGGLPLTEGPVLALTIGALLGSWWLLNHRTTAGSLMLAGSLLVGTAVKYSTFLLVAGALGAAALVCLLIVAGTRHRGTYLLAALNTAAVIGIGVLSIRYSLPGSSETLQDTFTNHFAQPDVDAPWPMLGELNANYWTHWLQEQARSPWLIAAVGLGAWGLFRHNRALAWPVLAVGMTGLAAEIAHPVYSQGDRLMVNVWIVAVLGLPLLLDQVTRRRGAQVPGPS